MLGLLCSPLCTASSSFLTFPTIMLGSPWLTIKRPACCWCSHVGAASITALRSKPLFLNLHPCLSEGPLPTCERPACCRCSNAETTLVQQVGSRNDKAGLLLDYYLFNQGGTLSEVADQATGVNFDSMEAQLNSTATDAVSVRCLP